MEDKEIKITTEKGPVPDLTPLSLSYGTYVSIEDYMKLFEEWNKLRDSYLETLEENAKLKQLDANKDSRNSRQRIANKKLLDKVKDLEEQVTELEFLTGLRQKRNLITKFELMYSHEKVQEYKKQGKYIAGVYLDAEEVYRRYFVYKNGVESLVDSIYEMKVNDEDYKAIVNVVTKSLANMQKGEKNESIYKEG